jgi:tetratricopeptide (TPR) repeat protein
MSGTDPRREHAGDPPIDPGQARTLDDLVELLRSLKVWAGDPSYEKIKDRVNVLWTAAGRPSGELTKKTTVVDCFKTGRRRLNSDLLVAIVEALHPDTGYVAQWRQAFRVVGGEIKAVSQVRVQDSPPQDLATFTGRTAELRRLRRILDHASQDGGSVVISAIEGMAGVGKTQLAVRAAHLLDQEKRFQRVLFVNLRGFHPDPAQPPADPAAVLDGFLRLLGVPPQQIPNDLDGRTRVYRARLAETRSLVILDNAASTDQIRPLLTQTAGCPVLITSRRRLHDLDRAVHLAVDVFTPQEAVDFLARAAPQVAVGEDPDATARVAEGCGHLPLALGLIAGHMRNKPDWTSTDHADWLDDRHRHHRLDTGVETAFDLSYNDLPAHQRRLLRLLALHPGQDFDTNAAAALAGIDPDDARTQVDRLREDHLLQRTTAGRYTFHDLIRAYATTRAHDEERPPERRNALTRLLDYHLYAAHRCGQLLATRQFLPNPDFPDATVAIPVPTDRSAAIDWFTVELDTLLACIPLAAGIGLHSHACQLALHLIDPLDGQSRWQQLESVQRTAVESARRTEDQALEGHARRILAQAYARTGRHDMALAELRQAHRLFESRADHQGLSHTHRNLAIVCDALGRVHDAMRHAERTLRHARLAADRSLEANGLNTVGLLEVRHGDPETGLAHCLAALPLSHRHAPRTEPYVLDSLGQAYLRLGRWADAIDNFKRCIALHDTFNDRRGVATSLLNLGDAYESSGDRAAARQAWRQALNLFDELQHPDTELARNRLRDHPNRTHDRMIGTGLSPHVR